MASCAGCDQSISYARFWISVFGNFRRNMTERSKLSPVVTCPHCRSDNAQKLGYSLAQFACMVVIVALSFVVFAPLLGPTPVVIVALGVYMVFDYVWWTRVTRLNQI
jgi:cell division protein FtsW (lipid II flippase)